MPDTHKTHTADSAASTTTSWRKVPHARGGHYHGILIENRGSARPLEALRRATGDHTQPLAHTAHAHRSGPHTLTHTLSLPDFCMFCKSYLDLVRC